MYRGRHPLIREANDSIDISEAGPLFREVNDVTFIKEADTL